MSLEKNQNNKTIKKSLSPDAMREKATRQFEQLVDIYKELRRLLTDVIRENAIDTPLINMLTSKPDAHQIHAEFEGKIGEKTVYCHLDFSAEIIVGAPCYISRLTASIGDDEKLSLKRNSRLPDETSLEVTGSLSQSKLFELLRKLTDDGRKKSGSMSNSNVP